MDMKSEMILKYIKATLDDDVGVPEDAAMALYDFRDVLDESDPLHVALTTLLAQVDATNGRFYITA
jgi:hypothetical protein